MSRILPLNHFDFFTLSYSVLYALFDGENRLRKGWIVAELCIFEYGNRVKNTFQKMSVKVERSFKRHVSYKIVISFFHVFQQKLI